MYSTTLGWRMVNPRMPSAGRSPWARAPSCWRLAMRSRVSARTSSPTPVTTTRRRPGSPASTRAGWCPVAAAIWSATRTSSRRSRSSSWPSAGRRSAENGTVTAGNSSPLNDGAAAVLIASEAAADEDRYHAARADRGQRRLRNRSGHLRRGPDRGRQPCPGSRGHRVEGCVRGRAQRGLRVAVTGLHRRLAGSRPRGGEPQRRRDRARPSAGRVRRPGARRARARARRRGGGWGVATLCIGVGQGLAVVLEGVARERLHLARVRRAKAGSRELADRVPPGQYVETGFPVLTAGPTPAIDPEAGEWSFRIDGMVASRSEWSWQEFGELESEGVPATSIASRSGRSSAPASPASRWTSSSRRSSRSRRTR